MAPSICSATPPCQTASSSKSSASNPPRRHTNTQGVLIRTSITSAAFFSAALFSAASTLSAQQAPPAISVPDTFITVTATEPLPLDAQDRSILSLTLSDQATQPLYNSVVDYLRLDTSLTLQERAPSGIQADISMRGSSFEQTLVLINGLRVNDPETGHLNLDLSLPLEAISRVDILHGSGSTLFGSDAIGGAVNLITQAPTHGSATLRLGGGSFASTEQHLQLSGVTQRIAARLTATRDTSDGFSYRGGLPGINADRGYHANLAALDSFITFSPRLAPTEILLGASDRPYGANLFYGRYDSAERTKGWFASIRQPLGHNTIADFAFRRHTDLFILKVSNPNLYRNNHVDGLWQADLRKLSALPKSISLAYGLEADGDTIRSTNLGHHARNQGAGYASLSIHSFRRLTLSVGAREEILAGPTAVFAPSAAAGYFLGHGLRLHAAVGKGFRTPTYIDLYYSDPTTKGNPTLKAETSQSYEGGVEYLHGTIAGQPRLHASATVFTLRQANAIDYSKLHVTDKYQATNVGNIAYTGVESSLTFRPATHHQLDLGYTFTHAGLPPAGLISEYAYNFASSNASLAYQATFANQIAARTQLSVIQQTNRTAYPLWTVAVTRSQGLIRPYARAENLANTSYQELPNVPLAGRTLTAGITLTLPSGK